MEAREDGAGYRGASFSSGALSDASSDDDDDESHSLQSGEGQHAQESDHVPDPHAEGTPRRRRSRRWQDRGVSFDAALLDERRFIQSQFHARGLGAVLSGDGAFSVAFSGGGVRAAAFQAGVLWRLAEAGCLGKVEHLVAVSGGAYVACAFASHLVAAKQPDDRADLDAWYRRIVAKTLCRMQRNIGYLIRDWSNGALAIPKDGSGLMPPIMDIPALLGVILLTLLSNPLTHFVVYMIPLTECVNQFMGMAMRAAYCAPDDVAAWRIFEWWGPLHGWIWNLILLLSFTFLAWILGKLPFLSPPAQCEAKDRGSSKHRPWYCRLGFLYLQSLRAATTRILVIYSLIVVVLCGILSTELWDPMTVGVGTQSRRAFCADYIRAGGRNPATLERHEPTCDDMRLDSLGRWAPWWEDPVFDVYRVNGSFQEASNSQGGTRPEAPPSLDLLPKEETQIFQLIAWPFHQRLAWSGSSLCISMIMLLIVVLGVALLLTPIFKGLFILCLSLVGPTVALLLAASWMQYRIFGPLTGQYYVRLFELWPFHIESYQLLRLWSLAFAFVLMVFFHGIHFASHYYYSRSLRLAYFENGRDLSWNELRQNPLCPFMLLTGTITDWKRPGEREGITEISISALHTGSSKTGYVVTPPWRSVAKCMALAAAAIDAFILGMFDRLRYRFWLEFLNLRMGDYLLFERWRNPVVAWCQKRTASCRRESFFFYEFPVVAFGGCAFFLFIVACGISQSSDSRQCISAYRMYVVSLYIVIGLFFLSFFGFVPILEFFVHSPMIRQIHMALRYYHTSETPPSMIFVSDGGVQDCTGILQLMHRRVGRILLVLASEDPEDGLGVLRETIQVAVRKKLGSFYDPRDPRRDVSFPLDEFRADKSQSYIHLGIRYGWRRGDTAPDGRQTGHLFVVKNRLTTCMEGLPLDPLLTEEDIALSKSNTMSRSSSIDSCCSMDRFSTMARDRRMVQEDLAGCCCNFCHLCGCNFGPKFPHIANANQCLTPALFSVLCRLGHRLSEEAVQLVSRKEGFEEPWERWVA